MNRLFESMSSSSSFSGLIVATVAPFPKSFFSRGFIVMASQSNAMKKKRGSIWGFFLRFMVFSSVFLNIVLISVILFEKEGSFMEERGVMEQICFDGGEKGENMCSSQKGSVVLVNPSSSSHSIVEDETCSSNKLPSDAVINLDHGDPTMFETFWKNHSSESTILIHGWQSMSYFSRPGSVCWFLEPEFAQEVRKLHRLVGNAVTDDRHIIVGTGSTQLFQAAIYALCDPDSSERIGIVSEAPYYSSYPTVTDYVRSEIYRWAGDAYEFNPQSPYIELVTSPNNPDGHSREAVVKGEGSLIHDLAYYWPQYVPITKPADHDIMLFTVSKITGHAGTRIGWAVVKDGEVAKRMTKFIELNTIGVSKDSQLRAAKILGVVLGGYNQPDSDESQRFFEFGRALLDERWRRLREVVSLTGRFSLPEFTPDLCNFFGRMTTTSPAFAWLKYEGEDVEDLELFLKYHKILTRSGKQFGADPKFVRISMIDRDKNIDLLIERLAHIQSK